MATPINKFTFQESVIKELLDTVKSYCEQRNIHYKTLNARRPSRCLKNGDFVVPKGCMGELSGEDVSSVQYEIVQKTQTSLLPIGRVTQDKLHTLVLFVDRPKAYQNVISQVLHEGDCYGKTDRKEKKLVFLNSVDLAAACADSVLATDDSDSRIVFHEKTNSQAFSPAVHGDHAVLTTQCPDNFTDTNHLAPDSCCDKMNVGGTSGACRPAEVPAGEVSVQDCTKQTSLTPVCLRALVLFKHIAQLLHATGHGVVEVPCSSSTAVVQLCHLLGYQLRQSSADVETLRVLTHRAEVSPFRNNISEKQRGEANMFDVKNQGCEGDNKSVGSSDYSEDVVMDLGRFIHEALLVQGKTAYDKNLHLLDVKHVDGFSHTLHRVARLENCFVVDGQQLSTEATCVHVVSHNVVFTQLQTDLLWKILSPAQRLLKQSHLVVGSVISRKEGIGHCHISAEDFIRLRYKQIKQLSDEKYGNEFGSGLESTLMNLTAAVIKFEMLNTACKNNLKLDVTQHADGGPGAETKAGLFVIYNCARMATLFRHFQDQVQKGIYPELSSVDDINFELLREEEEWGLLFNYISLYPDVVKNSVEDTGPQETDIYAKIHTHKIVNFLIGLSRSVSSYYRRFHILGEGKPHLLPVMYARLYLMKAVHQVMKNGLLLLDIQPFSEI